MFFVMLHKKYYIKFSLLLTLIGLKQYKSTPQLPILKDNNRSLRNFFKMLFRLIFMIII
jgi:hypothetical protein